MTTMPDPGPCSVCGASLVKQDDPVTLATFEGAYRADRYVCPVSPTHPWTLRSTEPIARTA